MAVLRIIHRMLLFVALTLGAAAYLAAILSYSRYGKLPAYDCVGSWCSYPMDTGWWPDATVSPTLLILVFLVGIPTSAAIFARTLFSQQRRIKDAVEAAAFLGVLGLLFLDPWGVSNWYFD